MHTFLDVQVQSLGENQRTGHFPIKVINSCCSVILWESETNQTLRFRLCGNGNYGNSNQFVKKRGKFIENHGKIMENSCMSGPPLEHDQHDLWPPMLHVPPPLFCVGRKQLRFHHRWSGCLEKVEENPKVEGVEVKSWSIRDIFVLYDIDICLIFTCVYIHIYIYIYMLD